MEPLEGASTVERMLLNQASASRTPINGSLELLPLCNMNCDMCYVRLNREEMERQGRLHTAEEWLHVAGQMQRAGVLFLLLTGGEPFLYPEFRYLYMELKKLGMILTINTNGTLIDEDLADFLAKYKPRRVNITLYGADETAYRELCHYPGGFEKTIHGICLLKERGIDVKIGGSLTRTNHQDMTKILDIGDRLDVPVRIDTYMLPATRERSMPYNLQSRLDPEEAAKARVEALRREMGSELFEQYCRKACWEVEHILPENGPGHMSCLAGKCSFTINWQGEMRPCVIMTEPAVSVFKSGFEDAWKYITEETNKILLSTHCRACHLRPLCRTCAASALLETGRYDGVPEYMCRYTECTMKCLTQEMEHLESPEND